MRFNLVKYEILNPHTKEMWSPETITALSKHLEVNAREKNLDYYVIHADDRSDSLVLISALILSGINFIVAPRNLAKKQIRKYLINSTYEIVEGIQENTKYMEKSDAKMNKHNPMQKIG